ncbi:MAG: polysaccharide pyruvyl transferase family protein [Phycisphaeraceae bacterium]|nr:polysaccharide pyruvyl transferase family protein [Phycisphaeraceae bacterium]
MRIVLLNETAIYPHIGCLAVGDAHARMLGAMGHEVVRRRFVATHAHLSRPNEAAAIDAALSDPEVVADIEACDAVVLNAEGSVHHGLGLQWLAILGAAQRLGKRTLIINGVLEDVPGFDGVLSAVEDLCLRDVRSADYMKSRGIRCRVVPDSFFEASFDDQPLIDLSGRIVITDWHSARNNDVGRIMMGYWRSLPASKSFYYPFAHGSHHATWRSALANIARAELLVTARHHGVCLAGRAGIPFVALPSNTWKIEGMIEASGVPIPVCRSSEQLESAIAFARSNPAVFREFAAFIREARPLSTLSALAPPASDPRPSVRGEAGAQRELRTLADQVRGVGPWLPSPEIWTFGVAAENQPSEAAPCETRAA